MTHNKKAFTLIELLVVISIIGLIAAMLLPSLSKGKRRAESISCVNNLKQLQLGWKMYVDDNNGNLPENKNVNMTMSPLGSWVTGFGHWGWDPQDLIRGSLFVYIKTPKTYHCPTDRSSVPPPGNPTSLRNRSYSLNGFLNGSSTEFPITSKTKESQIGNSSQTFSFGDENEQSLNDGLFYLQEKPSVAWPDLPSDRHFQGCNLSFVDGHVVHLKWFTPKVFTSHWQVETNTQGLLDLCRIQSMLSPY